MEAQLGHSKVCCNIPPVISTGYESKGTYETIGGIETYVTGFSTSNKAILLIYDIFGFFPQTLQGADILSTSDPEHQYQVFIPDFFEGEAADIAWYPPVTESQQKALGEWFPSRTPAMGLSKVPKIVSEIESIYGQKSWGSVGFCWGGKVLSLQTQLSPQIFKASAQCHPAMLSPDDASQINTPTLVITSGEEDVKEVAAFEGALMANTHLKDGEREVAWFKEQVHGFMTARGDLEDEKVKQEYGKAYGIVLEFLGKFV